jgi:TPR repeat protein
MRLAPGGDRNRVLWLLHFLESWYDKDELNQQAQKHTKAIAARRYSPQFAYSLTEALAKTGQLEMDTEHRMLSQTQALLREFNPSLAEELSLSDQDLFAHAEECCRNEDYQKAVKFLLKIKHKHDQIYSRLGECFIKLASYNKAAQCYSKAAENGNVEAMLQLARLYRDTLKDVRQAEKYYLKAVGKDDLNAMLSLGNLYYHTFHDYPKAEQYYIMTVKEGRKRSKMLTSGTFSLHVLKKFLGAASKGKGEHEQPQQHDVSGVKSQYLGVVKHISAEAMCLLGNLYAHKQQDAQKAQQYYIAAIKAGHREAIIQLGMMYHYMVQDYKKAAKYYMLALKRGDEINAAVNLGALYQNELKDYNQAKKYYALAAKKGDAGGLNGLAWLYFEQKVNKEHALKYAWKAAEKENNMYTLHTLACIYLWNNKPQSAIKTAQGFMYNKAAYKHLKQDILFYLMLLLAKKQYQAFAVYFDASELKLREMFKPLYFTYLYTIRDEKYYRRPPELVEPIKGLLGRITRLALDYA